MPADPILTLAWLVLAHLVADFVVQTGGRRRRARTRAAPGRGGACAPTGSASASCLVPVVFAFGLPGLWALVAIVVDPRA